MKRNKRIIALACLMLAATFSPILAKGKKENTEAKAPQAEETAQTGNAENAGEQKAEEAPEDKIDWSKYPTAYIKPVIKDDPLEFNEIWGYVMTSREKYFSKDMPITDLCYFSADVNSYGELSSIPNPKQFAGFKGRIHLVVTCTGRALTHFSMTPGTKEYKGILDAIESASKKYDGIQIDYENIGARDAGNFLTYLKDIRKRIGPNKILSVALPARTRAISDDIFNYKKIEPLVDRILIMAYDEHWSGSKPGPVASMDWCKKVADYAKTVIPQEKLIMGLPFYGRSWEDYCYSDAWIYTSMNRIMKENDAHRIERDNGVAHVSFDAKTHVEAYFDDAYSLVERSKMYQSTGIQKIGFWRIGQEDSDIWNYLKIKK